MQRRASTTNVMAGVPSVVELFNDDDGIASPPTQQHQQRRQRKTPQRACSTRHVFDREPGFGSFDEEENCYTGHDGLKPPALISSSSSREMKRSMRRAQSFRVGGTTSKDTPHRLAAANDDLKSPSKPLQNHATTTKDHPTRHQRGSVQRAASSRGLGTALLSPTIVTKTKGSNDSTATPSTKQTFMESSSNGSSAMMTTTPSCHSKRTLSTTASSFSGSSNCSPRTPGTTMMMMTPTFAPSPSSNSNHSSGSPSKKKWQMHPSPSSSGQQQFDASPMPPRPVRRCHSSDDAGIFQGTPTTTTLRSHSSSCHHSSSNSGAKIHMTPRSSSSNHSSRSGGGSSGVISHSSHSSRGGSGTMIMRASSSSSSQRRNSYIVVQPPVNEEDDDDDETSFGESDADEFGHISFGTIEAVAPDATTAFGAITKKSLLCDDDEEDEEEEEELLQQEHHHQDFDDDHETNNEDTEQTPSDPGLSELELLELAVARGCGIAAMNYQTATAIASTTQSIQRERIALPTSPTKSSIEHEAPRDRPATAPQRSTVGRQQSQRRSSGCAKPSNTTTRRSASTRHLVVEQHPRDTTTTTERPYADRGKSQRMLKSHSNHESAVPVRGTHGEGSAAQRPEPPIRAKSDMLYHNKPEQQQPPKQSHRTSTVRKVSSKIDIVPHQSEGMEESFTDLLLRKQSR